MIARISDRPVNLPDFLIVGAQKSGTTSLYHYLRQHPRIFMPDNKEPHFFSHYGKPSMITQTVRALVPELISQFDNYKKLFESASPNQVLGEASTAYLFNYKQSIKNIKELIPEWQHLRIIIVLRDPAIRAFSHYSMMKQYGEEPFEFKDAILQKREPIFDYLGHGFYYERVKAYMDAFHNTKVYLLEDMKTDPKRLMNDLCDFLGIDRYVFEFKKYFVSKEIRNQAAQNLVESKDILSSRIKFLKLLPLSFRAAPFKLLGCLNSRPINKDIKTIQKLRGIFRKDILNLQDLINRDLSAWL